MRRRAIVPLALALLAPAAAAADSPPTAADLVANNLEARGGATRWSAVRTIELRGTFDAWSDPVAMTIQRARPARYRFDHSIFGAPAVLATDGTTPWLEAAAFGVNEGQPIDEPWKRNVTEDAAFVSRLQELAAAGATIELLGRGDVDGVPAWKLRVAPAGFPPEVWYLDVATALELERESTTFDVFSGGIEMPMETYYMDFRDVEGLKLPFREERHFGTRYHVYEIASVAINPEIDPARFAVPVKKEEAPKREDAAPAREPER